MGEAICGGNHEAKYWTAKEIKAHQGNKRTLGACMDCWNGVPFKIRKVDTLKNGQLEGYKLGVLQAIEIVHQKFHEDLIAEELLNSLLHGMSKKELDVICWKEDIRIDFRKVRRKP